MVLEYQLVRLPQIDKLLPDFIAHQQLILSDESILKHQLIVINKRIETAIVDQFLELPFLIIWQLIIFMQLILLLEKRGRFVREVAVVCKDVEDIDVADVERIFLEVLAVVDFLLYLLAV